jgi:hypothetical protein
MEREDLKPETTYYVRKDDQYFWSPDGEGGYWYETLEELEEQHGEQDLDEIEEIEELFD